MLCEMASVLVLLSIFFIYFIHYFAALFFKFYTKSPSNRKMFQVAC